MSTIEGTQKKLTVSGEAIESAVNSKHEHSNSAVLNKLSDNNGTLQYNGSDITGGGSSYTLPTASTTELGGVKVDGSTITINGDGIITAETGEATNNALYKLKGEIGLGTLKGLFDKRVDNYIKTNGYKINEITKTRREIKDWMLNRDNCLYRGKLYKNGKYLVDVEGKVVEIRGIGTHHLLQYSNLHTKECLETLKYYGINCIRLTAYLQDLDFKASNGTTAIGYLNSPTETRTAMDKIIGYCIELGLYVLIDWHIYESPTYEDLHVEEAKEFFQYFSSKYKDTPNVFYELANEPYDVTADELVTFLGEVRNVVLANDPDAVMVSGFASGGIYKTYAKLVEAGYTDIFLSPHSYNDVAKKSYEDMYRQGYPLFATEWGNSALTGDSEGEEAHSNDLLDWHHETGVGHCFWKYTDQTMTTSVLKNRDGEINNEYYKYGGFTEEDLSYNGKLFLNAFQDYAFENYIERTSIDAVTAIPTESYKEKGVAIVLDTKNTVQLYTNAGDSAVYTSSYFNIPIKQNTYYKVIKCLDGNRFRGGIHKTAIEKTPSEVRQYYVFEKLIAYNDTLKEVTFYSGDCNYLTFSYSSKYENCLLKLVEIPSTKNTLEQTYTYVVTDPGNVADYRTSKVSVTATGLVSTEDQVKCISYFNIPVTADTTYTINITNAHDRFRIVYSETPFSNGTSGTVIVDDTALNTYSYTPVSNGYITVYVSNSSQSVYVNIEGFADKKVSSISAVFNQGSNVIYNTDSLDTLKQYLTVTASYEDSTTATITNYSLSGTLAVGTSTVTVTSGTATTTFNVTVTENAGGGTDYTSLLELGAINSLGAKSDSDSRVRTISYIKPSYTTLVVNDGFRVIPCVYNSTTTSMETWVGYYNPDTQKFSNDGNWVNGTIDLTPIYTVNSDYTIKLLFKNEAGDNTITVANVAANITLS